MKAPGDAQPAVDSLLKLGGDFIKVHSHRTRDSCCAIARAVEGTAQAFGDKAVLLAQA